MASSTSDHDLALPAGHEPYEVSESGIAAARLADWTHAGFEREMTSANVRQYLFIHKGGGSAMVDGTSWELVDGSILVVPETSSLFLQLRSGTNGIWFSGTPEFLNTRVTAALYVPRSDYWLSYHIPKHIDVWTGANRVRDRDRIQLEMEAALDRLGFWCDTAVIAYLLVIMFVPGRSVARRPVVASDAVANIEDPAVRLLILFRGLIEQNFREHLPIEEYCRRLAVRPSRLAQASLAVAGRTPLALIHERLLIEAKRELMTTARSVSEIAYRLGYSDPAYFSRFFRQHVGVSPIKFRELDSPAHPAA